MVMHIDANTTLQDTPDDHRRVIESMMSMPRSGARIVHTLADEPDRIWNSVTRTDLLRLCIPPSVSDVDIPLYVLRVDVIVQFVDNAGTQVESITLSPGSCYCVPGVVPASGRECGMIGEVRSCTVGESAQITPWPISQTVVCEVVCQPGVGNGPIVCDFYDPGDTKKTIVEGLAPEANAIMARDVAQERCGLNIVDPETAPIDTSVLSRSGAVNSMQWVLNEGVTPRRFEHVFVSGPSVPGIDCRCMGAYSDASAVDTATGGMCTLLHDPVFSTDLVECVDAGCGGGVVTGCAIWYEFGASPAVNRLDYCYCSTETAQSTATGHAIFGILENGLVVPPGVIRATVCGTPTTHMYSRDMYQIPDTALSIGAATPTWTCGVFGDGFDPRQCSVGGVDDPSCSPSCTCQNGVGLEATQCSRILIECPEALSNSRKCMRGCDAYTDVWIDGTTNTGLATSTARCYDHDQYDVRTECTQQESIEYCGADAVSCSRVNGVYTCVCGLDYIHISEFTGLFPTAPDVSSGVYGSCIPREGFVRPCTPAETLDQCGDDTEVIECEMVLLIVDSYVTLEMLFSTTTAFPLGRFPEGAIPYYYRTYDDFFAYKMLDRSLYDRPNLDMHVGIRFDCDPARGDSCGAPPNGLPTSSPVDNMEVLASVNYNETWTGSSSVSHYTYVASVWIPRCLCPTDLSTWDLENGVVWVQNPTLDWPIIVWTDRYLGVRQNTKASRNVYGKCRGVPIGDWQGARVYTERGHPDGDGFGGQLIGVDYKNTRNSVPEYMFNVSRAQFMQSMDQCVTSWNGAAGKELVCGGHGVCTKSQATVTPDRHTKDYIREFHTPIYSVSPCTNSFGRQVIINCTTNGPPGEGGTPSANWHLFDPDSIRAKEVIAWSTLRQNGQDDLFSQCDTTDFNEVGTYLKFEQGVDTTHFRLWSPLCNDPQDYQTHVPCSGKGSSGDLFGLVFCDSHLWYLNHLWWDTHDDPIMRDEPTQFVYHKREDADQSWYGPPVTGIVRGGNGFLPVSQWDLDPDSPVRRSLISPSWPAFVSDSFRWENRPTHFLGFVPSISPSQTHHLVVGSSICLEKAVDSHLHTDVRHDVLDSRTNMWGWMPSVRTLDSIWQQVVVTSGGPEFYINDDFRCPTTAYELVPLLAGGRRSGIVDPRVVGSPAAHWLAIGTTLKACSALAPTGRLQVIAPGGGLLVDDDGTLAPPLTTSDEATFATWIQTGTREKINAIWLPESCRTVYTDRLWCLDGNDRKIVTRSDLTTTYPYFPPWWSDYDPTIYGWRDRHVGGPTAHHWWTLAPVQAMTLVVWEEITHPDEWVYEVQRQTTRALTKPTHVCFSSETNARDRDFGGTLSDAYAPESYFEDDLWPSCSGCPNGTLTNGSCAQPSYIQEGESDGYCKYGEYDAETKRCICYEGFQDGARCEHYMCGSMTNVPILTCLDTGTIDTSEDAMNVLQDLACGVGGYCARTTLGAFPPNYTCPGNSLNPLANVSSCKCMAGWSKPDTQYNTKCTETVNCTRECTFAGNQAGRCAFTSTIIRREDLRTYYVEHPDVFFDDGTENGVQNSSVQFCECSRFAFGYYEDGYVSVGNYQFFFECSNFVEYAPNVTRCTDNGGSLLFYNGSGVPYCDCPFGKTGTVCEFTMCPIDASGNVCGGRSDVSCVYGGTEGRHLCVASRLAGSTPITTVCGFNDTVYTGMACEFEMEAPCYDQVNGAVGGLPCTVDSWADSNRRARGSRACVVQGTGISNSVAVQCRCPTGRQGVYCERLPCDDVPCNPIGGELVYDPVGDTCSCVCSNPYEGDECQYNTGECGAGLGVSQVCSGNGQCVCSGYLGETTCTGGEFHCVCDPGAHGPQCQSAGECPVGCNQNFGSCRFDTGSSGICECDIVFPSSVWRNTDPVGLTGVCTDDTCPPSKKPDPDDPTLCVCVDERYRADQDCSIMPCTYSGGFVCADIARDNTTIVRWPNETYVVRDQDTNTTVSTCGWVTQQCECDITEGWALDNTGKCVHACNGNNDTVGTQLNFDTNVITCVCAPYRTGSDCSLISPYDCKNGGLNVENTCVCAPHYYGIECEFLNCTNGGVNPTTANDTCACNPLFGGVACETLLCINNGTAVNDTDTACVCPFPWTDTLCDVDECDNPGVSFAGATECHCDDLTIGWDDVAKQCSSGGVIPDTSGVCTNLIPGSGIPTRLPSDRSQVYCACSDGLKGDTCNQIACFFDGTAQYTTAPRFFDYCDCVFPYTGIDCTLVNGTTDIDGKCLNGGIRLPDDTCFCVSAAFPEGSVGETEVQQFDGERCEVPICGNPHCYWVATDPGTGFRTCLYRDPSFEGDITESVPNPDDLGRCTLDRCGKFGTETSSRLSCDCQSGFSFASAFFNVTHRAACRKVCANDGVYDEDVGVCTCVGTWTGALCDVWTGEGDAPGTDDTGDGGGDTIVPDNPWAGTDETVQVPDYVAPVSINDTAISLPGASVSRVQVALFVLLGMMTAPAILTIVARIAVRLAR